MKGRLSKGVRFVREGVKTIGSRAAAKTCGARSFPIFGIPCGLTSGLGTDEGVKKTLYSSQPLSMCEPKTIEKTHFWHMRALLAQGTHLAEDGVVTQRQGTATYKGGNLSATGKLVTTFLQPIDGKPPHQDDLFRFSTKKFFPRIYHSKHPVLTLSTGWQGAFYHWVFEVLPRLHLAEKAGHREMQIYVESNFRFQKECLELLDIPSHRIINAHEYGAVTAPQLIIPSIPLIPPQWACQFLREKILPKLETKPPRRLYVSRNDASRRRILNEDSLFALLKKYGFEKVELSRFTFKEQAELFSTAEVVVGPHGAGFSHLVFCQPNTPVLEIFSPAYYNPCYWHVCDRVGLPYHYFVGEGENYPDGHDPHLDPDILVDLNKLEASLAIMNL